MSRALLAIQIEGSGGGKEGTEKPHVSTKRGAPTRSPERARPNMSHPPIWFGRSIIAIVMNSEQYRIEYLLGLLNSAYLNHLYSELVHEKGRVFAQVKLSKLAQLPIRMINFAKKEDKTQHDRLVQLVERVTKLAERQRSARSQQLHTLLERQRHAAQGQIDDIVRQLYDLGGADTGLKEVLERSVRRSS